MATLSWDDWVSDTQNSNNIEVSSGSFQLASAIPDSVVSRDPDDSTVNETRMFGIEVSTSVEWPDIGATISQNTVGATRAYIYRMSDGALIADTDISTLSAGDSFTFNLSDALQPDNYSFAVDAEGASYDIGWDDNPSFPYDSSDGDISIVGGTDNIDSGGAPTNSSPNTHGLVTVGDVGFK
jgi:hypothetical protein